MKLNHDEMERIRRAVCLSRGGLEQATDVQIMTIWNHLSPEVREEYMNKAEIVTIPKKTKGRKTNAPSSEPES